MHIFDLVKEELVGAILAHSDVKIQEREDRIAFTRKESELFTIYDNKRMKASRNKFKYRFTSFYLFMKQKNEDVNTEWAFNTDDEEEIVMKVRKLLIEAGV